MAKAISFNKWLETVSSDVFSPLANVWRTTRGRLTRASVEARAVALSCPDGTGAAAWDAYRTYLASFTPNPKVET